MPTPIPIKLLSEAITLPKTAYKGDAGFDLQAAEDASLEPGQRRVVACGIALAIPEGFAGLVIPRSGLAANHGISVVNAPGLIDSGYRGEIKVILLNTDQRECFHIHKGDRIAQLVIIKLPEIEFAITDSLSSSEREHGGFGSSGISA